MTWKPILLPALSLLLLLLASVESGRRVARITKEDLSSTCTQAYSNLSASHSRCLEDNPDAVFVELSNRVRNNILSIHNDYRKSVEPSSSDMMKLKWDNDLALTATKWAMQCTREHDLIGDRKEPEWKGVKIGQNLGWGHKNWKALLDRMYGEKERTGYVYGEGYLDGAGHFFQMVSAETTRVGCGQAKCPGMGNLRVCNYAPASNAGRPPYKNGTTCGDCTDHCTDQGLLCDCDGMLCYNGGTLDPATCSCVCQEGKTGDHCELVDCSIPDPFASCRSGVYSKEDCGTPGTVIEDITMCPHLCEVCPPPCGGKTCANGGVLDFQECTCACPGLLSGPTCETCPVLDMAKCNTAYPKSECGSPFVKISECPILCEACNTSCEPCLNHGILNTADCSCTCQGFFSGDRCEICPPGEEDPDFCIAFTEADCNAMPDMFVFARTQCPRKCGLCP